MPDKVDLLINALLDDTAREDEKDDAAMYLGEYDDDRVINALILKGKDLNENDIVLNSCGESLGIIWVRRNFFDFETYYTLTGTTRFGIYFVTKSEKPEWIEEYNLEKDKFLDA